VSIRLSINVFSEPSPRNLGLSLCPLPYVPQLGWFELFSYLLHHLSHLTFSFDVFVFILFLSLYISEQGSVARMRSRTTDSWSLLNSAKGTSALRKWLNAASLITKTCQDSVTIAVQVSQAHNSNTEDVKCSSTAERVKKTLPKSHWKGQFIFPFVAPLSRNEYPEADMLQSTFPCVLTLSAKPRKLCSLEMPFIWRQGL
jgi:hypothetical protein